MERTKKAAEPLNDGRIRYKKIGGGSLRWNRKIIKPGEIFLANPKDIPDGFKDVIIPMDAIPTSETPVEDVKGTQSQYTMVPRGKSKSLFDIVDSQGKRVNGEKALSKEVATKLIKDLQK